VAAGALGNLLPGGRPVADAAAREDLAQRWRAVLPSEPGTDTEGMLGAALRGSLAALVCGAVDIDDLPDPAGALAALDAADFVVSLEVRHSAVTDRANVVFPVAPVVEKPGTFLDWEGRPRPFEAALRGTGALPDQRVLHAIADEMGVSLGLPDAATARAELAALDMWDGRAPSLPEVEAGRAATPTSGEAVLASWRMLLDAGRMQDEEPYLAGTARTPVARLSAATAAEIGAVIGEPVTVETAHGAITLPLELAELPDRVVWLPLNSPGSRVYRQLGVVAGATVSIRAGDSEEVSQ
jgi:NADH-quinone oxidoreductase subunit G